MTDDKSIAFNEGRAAFIAEEKRTSNLYFNCDSYNEWNEGWDYEYNKLIRSEAERLRPLLFKSVPSWVAIIKLVNIGYITAKGGVSETKTVWLMYDDKRRGEEICPNQPKTMLLNLEVNSVCG
jgi:hypothetical protein